MSFEKGPRTPQSESSEKQENYEIIASNIDEFIAHQDDPEWRKKVAEDWYENLTKMPEMMKERTETDIKDEMTRNVAHEKRGILVSFEDFQRGHEQHARRMSGGNSDEYEEILRDHRYFYRNTVDNPGFVLAIDPEEVEDFMTKFKQDLAEGTITGIKQPDEKIEREKHCKRLSFSSLTEQKTVNVSVYDKSMYGPEDEDREFFCEPYSKENLQQLGKDFNVDVNPVQTVHYEWEGVKKFMEYFKRNNVSFELANKGGSIYAYHLVKSQ